MIDTMQLSIYVPAVMGLVASIAGAYFTYKASRTKTDVERIAVQSTSHVSELETIRNRSNDIQEQAKQLRQELLEDIQRLKDENERLDKRVNEQAEQIRELRNKNLDLEIQIRQILQRPVDDIGREVERRRGSSSSSGLPPTSS